jgi:hypothetical protein
VPVNADIGSIEVGSSKARPAAVLGIGLKSLSEVPFTG